MWGVAWSACESEASGAMALRWLARKVSVIQQGTIHWAEGVAIVSRWPWRSALLAAGIGIATAGGFRILERTQVIGSTFEPSGILFYLQLALWPGCLLMVAAQGWGSGLPIELFAIASNGVLYVMMWEGMRPRRGRGLQVFRLAAGASVVGWWVWVLRLRHVL